MGHLSPTPVALVLADWSQVHMWVDLVLGYRIVVLVPTYMLVLLVAAWV